MIKASSSAQGHGISRSVERDRCDKENWKVVVGEISRESAFKIVRWAQSCGDGASEFGEPESGEWGFL